MLIGGIVGIWRSAVGWGVCHFCIIRLDLVFSPVCVQSKFTADAQCRLGVYRGQGVNNSLCVKVYDLSSIYRSF